MRRMLSAAAVVAAGLLVPSAANAAIPQVFTKTTTPINCTVQLIGVVVFVKTCGIAAFAADGTNNPAATTAAADSILRIGLSPPP